MFCIGHGYLIDVEILVARPRTMNSQPYATDSLGWEFVDSLQKKIIDCDYYWTFLSPKYITNSV